MDRCWRCGRLSILDANNNTTIAAYHSFSPATAQDDALSGNVKPNGIAREKATRSEVDILLVGTKTINGSVRDDNNTVWDLPASVVLDVHGQALVSATCTVNGTIPAAYRPGNPERETVTTLPPRAANYRAVFRLLVCYNDRRRCGYHS